MNVIPDALQKIYSLSLDSDKVLCEVNWYQNLRYHVDILVDCHEVVLI